MIGTGIQGAAVDSAMQRFIEAYVKGPVGLTTAINRRFDGASSLTSKSLSISPLSVFMETLP